MSIRCAHCKGRHTGVADVRICASAAEILDYADGRDRALERSKGAETLRWAEAWDCGDDDTDTDEILRERDDANMRVEDLLEVIARLGDRKLKQALVKEGLATSDEVGMGNVKGM